jgi:DNA repair exonuclease SbcCD ATPase subunit
VGTTPILNELLEEAANRCLELTERAAGAGQALETLADASDTLRSRLANEGDEASRHLQELVSRLDGAQTRLETSASNAGTAFDTLGAKAAELQARVGQLVEQVRRSAGALESREDDLSTRLQARGEETQRAYQELEQHVADLQAAADTQLGEAAQALDAFRGAVDGARQDLGEAQTRLLEAMARVEAAAWEQTQAYVASVQACLQSAAQTLVEMGNRILAAHNEAVTEVRRKVAEEAAQAALGSLEPVTQAMAALGGEAAEHGATMRAARDRIAERVSAVAGVIRARVLPTLAQHERIR